jgi:hypothetical protein
MITPSLVSSNVQTQSSESYKRVNHSIARSTNATPRDIAPTAPDITNPPTMSPWLSFSAAASEPTVAIPVATYRRVWSIGGDCGLVVIRGGALAFCGLTSSYLVKLWCDLTGKLSTDPNHTSRPRVPAKLPGTCLVSQFCGGPVTPACLTLQLDKEKDSRGLDVHYQYERLRNWLVMQDHLTAHPTHRLQRIGMDFEQLFLGLNKGEGEGVDSH